MYKDTIEIEEEEDLHTLAQVIEKGEQVQKAKFYLQSFQQGIKNSSSNSYQRPNEVQYLLQSISLIEILRSGLSEYDTQFLSDYLNVVKSKNNRIISEVTNNILRSIEHVVRGMTKEKRGTSEPGMVVVACWLCAAAVWQSPRVGAAPLLRALLQRLPHLLVQQVGEACQHLPAPVLLALHDAACVPPPARAPSPAHALAARLLASAGEGARATGDAVLALRVAARRLRLEGVVPDLRSTYFISDIEKGLLISKVKLIFRKEIEQNEADTQDMDVE